MSKKDVVTPRRLDLFWQKAKDYISKRFGRVDTLGRFTLGKTLYLDNASMIDSETLSIANATYDEETETITIK